MRLYIVRHGKAMDAQPACSPMAGGTAAGDDFARELTPRGHAQARFLAQTIFRDEKRIRTIVASRFPRALQTAHAIQRPLACDLQTEARLEVDHEVAEVLEVIQEHAPLDPTRLDGIVVLFFGAVYLLILVAACARSDGLRPLSL